MERWIEVEDSFLSNQPARWKRRKGCPDECIPDPDTEPTEFYLSCYECWYTPKKRTLRRRRYLYTLFGDNAEQLNELLDEFIDRADVVLIDTPEKPLEYASSGQQPVPLSVPRQDGQDHE